MSSFKKIKPKLFNMPLYFEEGNYTKLFRQKNNKTLEETIVDSKRYHSLSEEVMRNYASYLSMPLGEFLYAVEKKNDDIYKRFLNPYGDLTYSIFSLAESSQHNLKGVYFYYLGDELMYIGRCRDSMKKRVNNGYGKISPKNCFLDGQSTNCKMNALITKHQKNISLKLYPLDDNNEIEKLETLLIQELKPKWNSRV